MVCQAKLVLTQCQLHTALFLKQTYMYKKQNQNSSYEYTVGTSEKEILELIKELQPHFPVKHLGSLEHFLGIHVHRNHILGILSLSQAKHVDNILNNFDMAYCSLISTPLIVHVSHHLETLLKMMKNHLL